MVDPKPIKKELSYNEDFARMMMDIRLMAGLADDAAVIAIAVQRLHDYVKEEYVKKQAEKLPKGGAYR